MEGLIFFLCGAAIVFLKDMLQLYRERRKRDVHERVIERLLLDMRSLQNRLSAKDISGFITQERYDDQQRRNGQQEVQEHRQPGYPQDTIGTY